MIEFVDVRLQEISVFRFQLRVPLLQSLFARVEASTPPVQSESSCFVGTLLRHMVRCLQLLANELVTSEGR